jgi:hypothetical protein
MSREERRQYRRMMKGVDPLAPPVPRGAARRRAERAERRRAARGPEELPRFTMRYAVTSLLVAALAGLIAFSLAWPNGGGFAFGVGIPVTVVVFGLAIGLRLLARRAASR